MNDAVVAAPEIAPKARRSKTSLTTLVDRERKRQVRRRVLVGVALVLVAAAAVVVWYVLRPQPVPIAQRFRTQPTTTGDIHREIEASGHLEAESTVSVGAEVSGRVLAVLADYNDVVTEGQVLARFDAASIDAQVAQLEAAIAAARASLAQADSDRDQAAANLTRIERLFAAHAIAASERDTAVFGLRSAEARVRAARAQIAAQQAAYSVARTSRAHTEIVSPITGVVITRSVDPGQTVVSALQSPVLFAIAADLRRMRVIAAVDEADVGEVHAGLSATFTVNAYPTRTFTGTVMEIRNAPVVVEEVVTYGSVVEVDNDDLALRPGMTASVHIATGSATSVVRVPNAALQFTPPGETAGTSPEVWSITNGAVRRIPVTTGLADGLWTEVRSGLSDGDVVITELTHEGRLAYGIAH